MNPQYHCKINHLFYFYLCAYILVCIHVTGVQLVWRLEKSIRSTGAIVTVGMGAGKQF